jgi:hypothetical protein
MRWRERNRLQRDRRARPQHRRSVEKRGHEPGHGEPAGQSGRRCRPERAGAAEKDPAVLSESRCARVAGGGADERRSPVPHLRFTTSIARDRCPPTSRAGRGTPRRPCAPTPSRALIRRIRMEGLGLSVGKSGAQNESFVGADTAGLWWRFPKLGQASHLPGDHKQMRNIVGPSFWRWFRPGAGRSPCGCIRRS